MAVYAILFFNRLTVFEKLLCSELSYWKLLKYHHITRTQENSGDGGTISNSQLVKQAPGESER